MAGNLVVAGVVMMAMALLAAAAAAPQGDVHVAGGDQGWDAASDLASWSRGRSFRVGDDIWFAYSPTPEEIAELASQAEYEACDVTNPIRMYAGGLDKVQLDREGPRYFASSSPEVCRKGLKLQVHVEPQGNLESPKVEKTQVQAAGPQPSASVEVKLDSLVAAMALFCAIAFS